MEDTNYSVFTVSDFLEDRDFIRYVKYGYPNDLAFWQNWEEKNPERSLIFSDAVLELKIILSPLPFQPSRGFEADLLNDIHLSISEGRKKRRVRKQKYFWISGIAASFFIAATTTWFFNATVRVHSDFGETRRITMPDGSEIVLNSNSTLTYPRAYAWMRERSIVLDGEAYFKVRHINQNPKEIKNGESFRAKTKSVEVQVLGTEFNLKERHHQVAVALINGKVQVKSLKTGKVYSMQPGNVIKVNSVDGAFIINKQGSDVQTSWTEGRMIVNQTTINEIITAFEDLYGYKVILDNPDLGDKMIDGSISIKSEESLLFTLSHILNVNVKKEGRLIRLQSRE